MFLESKILVRAKKKMDFSEIDDIEKLVDNLYKGIKLHKLNSALESFVNAGSYIISRFIMKHPILAIYFLNLIPDEKIRELLNKVSDDAIIYMIIEELQIILFRRLSLSKDANEVFILSTVINDIGSRTTESLTSAIDSLLIKIYEEESLKGRRSKFKFLSGIPLSRTLKLFQVMYSENPTATIITLLLLSDSLRNTIIDTLSKEHLNIINYLPIPIVRKFLLSHHTISDDIISHLKKEEKFNTLISEIQTILEKKFEIRHYIEGVLFLKKQFSENKITRNYYINKIYALLKELKEDRREIFLDELVYENAITTAEKDFLWKILKGGI